MAHNRLLLIKSLLHNQTLVSEPGGGKISPFVEFYDPFLS